MVSLVRVAQGDEGARIDDLKQVEKAWKKKAIIGSAGAAGVGTAAYPVTQKVPTPKHETKQFSTNSRASVKGLRNIATDEGFRFNNESHTAKLASRIRDKGFNSKFPVKVTRYKDGSQRVTDGHHRLSAAEMVGRRTIPVKVSTSDSKTGTVTGPLAFKGVRRQAIKNNRVPRERKSNAEINRLAGKKLSPALEWLNRMQAE